MGDSSLAAPGVPGRVPLSPGLGAAEHSASEPARSPESARSAQAGGAAGVRLGRVSGYPLVLDRMLPGVSGDDMLEAVRGDPAMRTVPVLVLTAKREQADRIRGLELGADDYLTKPFSPRELVLRVNAVLRRAHVQLKAVSGEGRILRAGPLRVVVGAHVVTRQAGRRGRVDRNGAGVRVPVPESCRVRTGGLAGATAAGRG